MKIKKQILFIVLTLLLPLSINATVRNDYDITKRYAFQDIMNMKMSEFDEDILQAAVNRESCRNVSRLKSNPRKISTKRLKNEYGLIRTVIHKYRKDIDFEEISETWEELIYKTIWKNRESIP